MSTAAVTPAASETPVPAPTPLPGADTAVVVYDSTLAHGGTSAGSMADAALDFARRFEQAFHVRTLTVDVPAPKDADGIGAVARQNGALIAIAYGAGFQTLSQTRTDYGVDRTYEFQLSCGIVDAYGSVWMSSGIEQKSIESARDLAHVVADAFTDLNGRAMVQFENQFSRQDTSVQRNLFRYALPMADGSKKTFFFLTPAARGAKAYVKPFSPAADAGLNDGDLVLAVNGKATAGQSPEQLSAWLLNQGAYDLIVDSPDGKGRHVTFEAKDLAWFVHRR
jgi:hypothetical protein